MSGSNLHPGFVRVAAISPELRPANPALNAAKLADAIAQASEQGAQIIATPELSLTGYTCGDLFFQDHLLAAAEDALLELVQATAGLNALVFAGLPLRSNQRLFNCAVAFQSGKILGAVPKTHLPGRGEFYEQRWFAPGGMAAAPNIVIRGGTDSQVEIPFGTDLLFETSCSTLKIGVEICEDLWTVNPPSGQQALAGATILVNCSASPDLLGKADYRRELVSQQSARCLAGYVYASAGPWESSAELVYGGHSLLAENGALLAESARFSFESQSVMADLDWEFLARERLRNTAFANNLPPGGRESAFRMIRCEFPAPRETNLPLLRPLPRTPFVPTDTDRRAAHCEEIFSIQSTGLARRVLHTKCEKLVLGVSGGLDSTLALLVARKALETLELPSEKILAVSMPGPGSTARTQSNACALAKQLGAEVLEIPIHRAVELHLSDLDHPAESRDITFENAQARERTQILMDLANKHGGIVLGTGDLSESALGWCTFNGDHMSMYHVNSGVPKTLVLFLVEWCAEAVFSDPVSGVLHDICATPITPELLPPGPDDSPGQDTEELIGPYVVHDFFLFHFVRRGAGFEKLLFLARNAFDGTFPESQLESWLRDFFRRFFASQFKRDSVPNGPKVGSVALSPRGDWRMPSDISPDGWIAEPR